MGSGIDSPNASEPRPDGVPDGVAVAMTDPLPPSAAASDPFGRHFFGSSREFLGPPQGVTARQSIARLTPPPWRTL
jgi:hypothetical protein